MIDDKSKEDEEEKAGTPEGKVEGATPTGKRRDKKDKQAEDKKDKRKTSAGKGKAVGRRGSQMTTTPPPGGAQTPGSDADGMRYCYK